MLRSRNKSLSTTQSNSELSNEPANKHEIKKYASITAQILIPLALIYLLWIFYSSRSNKSIAIESIDNVQNINDEMSDVDEFESLPKDSCEWRPENLVGTCFGLQSIKGIESAIQCKESCCNDAECITWQWHNIKGCQNGGNVRFGLERASTVNWCEPTKPRQWEGKRIKNKNEQNGECEWEEAELNTQCFGLGPEQKGIKTMEECAKICCDGKEKECEIWQWREDKGCFIGKSNNCDDDVLTYIGQRKVMPNGVFE